MPGLMNSTERATAVKRGAKYPGIRRAVDGSEAVVWVEACLSQAACAHAIPPADRMIAQFERRAAAGDRNLWGEPLVLHRTESSHSAASMCEGFALAGGRVTSFTGGQDLVQMSEVLYTAAGMRLPMVFHAAASSLASQAITIQAGHDDIAAVSDCGWGILFARNPQEAADLAVIARRAAELAETPFLNVQDGFITTHGLETVYLPEPELMRVFAGPPSRRVRKVFDSAQPLLVSPLENEDSYMRGRIAQRFFYERVRPSLETAMSDFLELTGRRYGPVRCYRMEDAEFAIAGLGSMMDTADAAVDYLRGRGVRAGSVSLTALRPFPAANLVNAIARCRAVTVVERTDTPLAGCNPLTQQLKAALAGAQMGEDARLLRVPEVFSGTAGVGGRATSAAALAAAIENMTGNGRRLFVLGIKHPDAIATGPAIDARPSGACTLRIHSRAGFGSTSAAKLIGSVASELFGAAVKVECDYHGEERAAPTSATVTMAAKRIQANGETPVVDLVAVHHSEAFEYSDPLAGLRDGGTLLIDTDGDSKAVWAGLPADVRRTLRERSIDLFAFDGAAIAKQSVASPDRAGRARGLALLGAFLKITPLRNPNTLPERELAAGIERALTRFFEHRGAAVVAEAMEITRRGYNELRPIVPPVNISDYRTPVPPRGSRKGFMPVLESELVPAGFCDQVLRNYAGGRESVLESDLYVARSIVPAGSAQARSFRQLAPVIPRFNAKHCTGCMECVNLCPDSAIGARVVDPETIGHVPAEIHGQFSFTAKYYEAYRKKGEAGGLFGLYIDADRCKGCGECVDVCGVHRALDMVPKTHADLDLYDRARDFFENLPDTPARFIGDKSLGDMLLSGRARLHTGGAGSCMGCGASSAIRMLLAATGFVYGAERTGVVAASGCHTAASGTYPFNPFQVSWTNTLAGNAPSAAMGIRMKWDRDGERDRRLWVIGGEDALMGAGLNSLRALLDSGMDVKVLVLYKGARETAGDLGVPLLLQRNVLVAQTTPAHINHFHRSVMAANEYNGPAVVICYSACTNDHGISDDRAAAQARLAVDSRTFPLFLSDPRVGDRVRERLDLRGNPALREDWFKDSKSLEPVDFITHARTEGRFATHFGPDAEPDAELQALRQAVLTNWRHLQELGGLR